MQSVSLMDRVLAHLYRYRYIRYDIQHGAPYELTQDGIGMSVGISRSHASILIKKLLDSKYIIEGSSTVKGGTRPMKRKIYVITELGRNRYLELEHAYMDMGVNLAEMDLTVNDRTFEDIKRLTDGQTDYYGLLCVLDEDVAREDLPDNLQLIRFTRDGKAYVKDSIRQAFLDKGTPDDLKHWHSKAADWCIDHDRPFTKKLIHLIGAERDREAMMIIRSMRYEVMDCCDEKLFDAVMTLAMRHPDPDISRIAVRMALDVHDLESAYVLADSVSGTDPELGNSARSEILLMKGNKKDALALAMCGRNSNRDAGIALGMSLLRNGRVSDAEACLEETRKRMLESGCLFRLDELLRCEALCEIAEHRRNRAAMLVNTALSLCRNERRRTELGLIMDWLRRPCSS